MRTSLFCSRCLHLSVFSKYKNSNTCHKINHVQNTSITCFQGPNETHFLHLARLSPKTIVTTSFGLNSSTGASRSAVALDKSRRLALHIFVVSNHAVQGTSCQCGNVCSGEVWAGTTSQVLGKGANMNNEATG